MISLRNNAVSNCYAIASLSWLLVNDM